MQKLIIGVALIILTITLFSRAAAENGEGLAISRPSPSPSFTNAASKIDPQVAMRLASLKRDDMMTVIVTLGEQADTRSIPSGNRAAQQQAVVRALQAKASASQRRIVALLNARSAQGSVRHFASFWVFNGLSVTATAGVIHELANRWDVASITPDEITLVPVANPALQTPEDNLAIVNAPALLNLGFAGQGVVVASMDSGVDGTHPDLAASWRGGSNSWFDPYNQHPTTPTDVSGHGTWTMGVMVGGDSGGTLIGMAPQAQWIAVKIFNDAGTATATAVHQGFQWLLDPDGNPATADAPQVVNNSWAFGAPGCNLEFQLDLQALAAMGILPVFAAGNFGPGTASSSPANYPEALAVGAVNNADQIYAYSSRGPSNCGEADTIYPELAAPGVNIKTADLFGLYYQATGTSLAAPHVSGALALLLSAFPGLTAEQQKLALLQTAVDLGAPGPDNDYGYGRLDALAAYQLLASGGIPTPTPLPPTPPPSPTPSSAPTATPLPPTPTPTATAVSTDLIFSDGFETGDFSRWTAVMDNEKDLSVTTAAAQIGSYGFAALIDNRTPMHLRDDSPRGERHYRAQFYFDPNSIRMGSGNTHRIFAARSSSADIIFLDFRYTGSVYQIQAGARTDKGKYTTTDWHTINDASQIIEVDWQAATGAGANNGYLALRLDNTARQTIRSLDNDTTRIEEARLGPLGGIDNLTVGVELFDGFVSQRTNPSGQ